MIRIGLTLGDPKGVGPELCAAALAHFAGHAEIQLQCYGRENGLTAQPALADAEAGRRSAAYVAAAVRDLVAHRIDSLVTAPIHKARWQAAGIPAMGHTDYLATLVHPAAPPATHMLFYSEHLHLGVALVCDHVPLAAVPHAVTPEHLTQTVQLTHDFFVRWHGRPPRLACLGLNPHAGEAGRFGPEERECIIPTLETLRRRGIVIDGPFPADTFFGWVLPAATPPYDAVIAMYHDQGLLPIKTLDPQGTVNVTLGLPFVRTSPAHGTADDAVGRADPRSMIAAVQLAHELTQTCRPMCVLSS